jgi:hypothetical protein
MSIESTTDQTKLAALRAIARPQVSEIVAVYWPAPDGTKYYAARALNELPDYAALTLTVEARLVGSNFLPINRTSSIADEQISLTFSEIRDREISRLFRAHGEGSKVEVFYYFPQVDLLVSEWSGHLRTPQRAGGGMFKTTAASGFRSALLPLPSRRAVAGCHAVIFGGLLTDQEQCLANDCPYDRHLGGVTGQLNGSGQPFTTIATSRAECVARHGTDIFYLGFDTVIESLINNQTKGPALLATSKGNETNLKQALRVHYGPRVARQLELLAYTPQFNTNHPDQGFVRVLFRIGEGRLKSVTSCKVNGALIGFEHLNVRRGERGQGRTGFSPGIGNYSRTAHFFAVYGPVNPAGYGPGNLNGECTVEGRDEIRVYTDQDTFTEQYTIIRAWCLLDVIREPRWGHKLDPVRFVMSDFIYLANWCSEQVGYNDANGNHFTGTRSTFVAELTERTAQQQINDICLFGRFTLPFEHHGKWRVLPLERQVIDDSIPVFTDYGPDRNIVFEKLGTAEITSVKRSAISDGELANQIVLTFEDASHGNVERPLTFSDQPQQLKAGKALGDTSIRVIEKKYSALGITNLGEAVRVGNLLLDLGEFDQGGLKNNLRVTFTTWYAYALELHQYQVIKVVSHEIEDEPFEYFRIMSFQRQSDLKVVIEAQAYPVDYYDRLEDSTQAPPQPGSGAEDNPGGGPSERPGTTPIGGVRPGLDQIEFDLVRTI